MPLHYSSLRALHFVALSLLPRVLATTDAPCYFPTGARADGFYPCDPTAYITQCCPDKWTCFSNGLCVITDPSAANSSSPIGQTLRGACTNPEWNSNVCGSFCLDDADAAGALQACGNDEFCCTNAAAQGTCNCATHDNTFSVGSGRAQTVIGIPGSKNTQTSSVTPAAATETGSSSRTSSTRSSSRSSSSSASATGAHNTISTKTSSPDKAKSTTGLKVGLSIGLIILALLILGFLIHRYFPTRKPKADGDLSSTEPSTQPPVPQTSPPRSSSRATNSHHPRSGPYELHPTTAETGFVTAPLLEAQRHPRLHPSPPPRSPSPISPQSPTFPDEDLRYMPGSIPFRQT